MDQQQLAHNGDHVPVDPALIEEDAEHASRIMVDMTHLAQVAAGTPYAHEPASSTGNAGPSYAPQAESTPNNKTSASGAAMLKQYGLEFCENSVDKAYHRYGADRCAACQQAGKSRCVPRKPGDPPTTCWLCAKNHVYCSFRGDPPRRRATLPKGETTPVPTSAPRPARAAAAASASKRKRGESNEHEDELSEDGDRPFNVPLAPGQRPALIITPEHRAAVAKAWGALTLAVEGQQRRLRDGIPIMAGEVGDLSQAYSELGTFLGYLNEQEDN